MSQPDQRIAQIAAQHSTPRDDRVRQTSPNVGLKGDIEQPENTARQESRGDSH